MANFAALPTDLSYWQKQTKPLFADLLWNVPERHTGKAIVVGGNSNSFATPAHTAEFLAKTFPFVAVTTILPDALRSKLPPAASVEFTPSTESGSFAKSPVLEDFFAAADATLVVGDLSRNSATAIALASAIRATIPSQPDLQPSPLVLTRDAVDLLAPEMPTLLTRPNFYLLSSLPQLQKVFRAVYYPKMILLSAPLLPLIETLHKFTLSYPATVITLHQEQIIVAAGGEVVTTPLDHTDYSPLSLWSGQLASRILALNYYNPKRPLSATAAAILHNQTD